MPESACIRSGFRQWSAVAGLARRGVGPRQQAPRGGRRAADPGARRRPAHVHPPPEQEHPLRGAVPLPVLRQRAGAAARHRGDQRPGRLPAAGHRRRHPGGVARRAPAPALRARGRALARPRRPRRRRRAAGRPSGHHRRRARPAVGAGVLRLHHVAAGGRAPRPRRPRARGHRLPWAPPRLDRRPRPVERLPPHRRHRLPRAALRGRHAGRTSPAWTGWWTWPAPAGSRR